MRLRKACDLRRSINSLATIVQQEMEIDPVRRSLFVFCNIRRAHLKILYWQLTISLPIERYNF
ncbi:MAG: IS66 family insertion sequence element accessory protein TnpB [Oligoflexus sp.]